MKSIEIINLDFSYNSTPFFKDFSFSVEQGEMVGLIGPNGSGKTTLINLIRGYLKPERGTILLFGRDIRKISRIEMGRMVSLVPQESRTSFNFTAFEIVSMGRYPHDISGSKKTSIEQVVMQALELTDSKEFAQKYFWNLSGGEKQRVILARAIAQQTDIVLLDEPTSSLDIKQAINLYRVIRKLNETAKITIVVATHDIRLISRFCRRAVLMKGGAIVGERDPKSILEKDAIEELFDFEDAEI